MRIKRALSDEKHNVTNCHMYIIAKHHNLMFIDSFLDWH